MNSSELKSFLSEKLTSALEEQSQAVREECEGEKDKRTFDFGQSVQNDESLIGYAISRTSFQEGYNTARQDHINKAKAFLGE